jgi:hypothetical protein
MTIGLQDFLDIFSGWAMFLATAAVCLPSLKIGFRLARTSERPIREQEAQVRTMTGAATPI